MNLLEIRTEIRRILAETTAASSYFSDADINRFINDGIKHMCIEAGVYEKTLSITVATTIATYTLPLEFLSMKTILNLNGIPLDPIETFQVGGTYKITGLPLNYYMTQAAATLPIWVKATAYVIFPATCSIAKTYCVPITTNGYSYECVTAGTSHASTEPVWTTVVGSTQPVDGTVYWKCRELFSTLFTLNLYDTPTTAGGGAGTYTLIYSALDEGLYVDTDTPNFSWNKHQYLVSYGCFKCGMKAKDQALAMAFLTEYSSGLGLKMGGAGGEGGPQS
jgi:hypothetical protein